MEVIEVHTKNVPTCLIDLSYLEIEINLKCVK